MFDPANKAFLDAISNGECPHELLPEHSGTAINVNMVRKDMDYEPAAQPRHVAFTGKGRTLTGRSPSMHQQRGPRISSVACRPVFWCDFESTFKSIPCRMPSVIRGGVLDAADGACR